MAGILAGFRFFRLLSFFAAMILGAARHASSWVSGRDSPEDAPRDLRLLLAFAAAVGLAVVPFAVLRRRLALGPVRFHRGLVPGAVAFGVGWALTGACPGVVLAQLGQGMAPALVSLAGGAARGLDRGSWPGAAGESGFGVLNAYFSPRRIGDP